MNEISIQICTAEDLELLAAMNKQLIEDEQHDNPMDTVQLKESWNEGGYRFWKSLGFKERSVYMRLEPSAE